MSDYTELKRLAEAHAQKDIADPIESKRVMLVEPAVVLALIAENEALRRALSECIASLHGEMLQKFSGQLPDHMHSVTRREYDRDMAELAEYRAALRKGEPV
ncbi:hypothetical protein AB3464_18160 [Pseudomonas asplenii]|uniref:hypothetical protein n=1 Tax=Pseudomonas asplenii TaxID=53407 RepID=UPI0037CB2F77